MIKRRLLQILLACTLATHAQAEEVNISRFATEGLKGWEHKQFKGATEYRIITENGLSVVRAHSQGTASGMYKKVNLDPTRFRYLRWKWKVSATVSGGNETSKSGDDYAARVYVIFPGRFFWQTRAINYIWANHLPVGQSIPNAYSANVMMVAVQSGSPKVGQWQNEQRDILADYRRLFKEDPREIGAIAIMTDTDNTGGTATAWYRDIVISTDE